MKKTLFLLIPALLFFSQACKKKDNNSSQPIIRVGNVYEDSNHVSTLYVYSPTQLLSGDYDDSGQYHYSYYYGNQQSVTEVQLSSAPSYSVYYIWNSLSLVDSSTTISGTGGIITRKKYTYDSNNFLSGVKWYNNVNALVLTESFTVTGGNLTQHSYNVIDTTNTSLPRGAYTYTYYSGEVNTLGNAYYGQSYLGASSANPVKSSTYSYGSTSSTVDYTYNYSGGNISSQLIFTDSSGVRTNRIDSFSYSYYIL